MSKLKDIINGWRAYIVNDETSNKIAKERAKVCSSCVDQNNKPIPVKGSFEILLPDYSIKEIQGLKCTLCKCPLSTATRSKNYKCPLGKW